MHIIKQIKKPKTQVVIPKRFNYENINLVKTKHQSIVKLGFETIIEILCDLKNWFIDNFITIISCLLFPIILVGALFLAQYKIQQMFSDPLHKMYASILTDEFSNDEIEFDDPDSIEKEFDLNEYRLYLFLHTKYKDVKLKVKNE